MRQVAEVKVLATAAEKMMAAAKRRGAMEAVVAVVAVVAAVVVRLHGGASAEPSRTRRLAASPILSRSLSGCVA